MAVDEKTMASQYLSFKLATETFAIDISKVREVLDLINITKVPMTPEFMLGVINLRGGVVPVLDMRLKFGMKHTERTVNTCVIIVEVSIGEEKAVLGALADSVQEVFELEPHQIEPAPKIGTQLNVDFLHGMGKRNEEFVLLLDIDKVFSEAEIAAISQSEDRSGAALNMA